MDGVSGTSVEQPRQLLLRETSLAAHPAARDVAEKGARLLEADPDRVYVVGVRRLSDELQRCPFEGCSQPPDDLLTPVLRDPRDMEV
jgi:hypothetical protein